MLKNYKDNYKKTKILSNQKLPLVLAFILLLLLSPVSKTYAQPESPDDPPPPTDVPLDGGISLLLASGLAYGLRKAANKNKAVKL